MLGKAVGKTFLVLLLVVLVSEHYLKLSFGVTMILVGLVTYAMLSAMSGNGTAAGKLQKRKRR